MPEGSQMSYVNQDPEEFMSFVNVLHQALAKLEARVVNQGNPPLQVDSFFILDTRLDERMLRLERKVMAMQENQAKLLAKQPDSVEPKGET